MLGHQKHRLERRRSGHQPAQRLLRRHLRRELGNRPEQCLRAQGRRRCRMLGTRPGGAHPRWSMRQRRNLHAGLRLRPQDRRHRRLLEPDHIGNRRPASRGCLHPGEPRPLPRMRAQTRRQDHLLGPEPKRTGLRSRRYIRGSQLRLRAPMRAPHRRLRNLLG